MPTHHSSPLSYMLTLRDPVPSEPFRNAPEGVGYITDGFKSKTIEAILVLVLEPCQMKMSEKIKAIRAAEKITQINFCEITGIPLSSLKNYEGGHSEPSLTNMLLITSQPRFEKYTLWLMTDKTAPEAGQISPAVSHSGPDETTSLHSGRKIG